MSNLFHKTNNYLKFLFKRERKYLIVFLFMIVILVLSQALSFADLYSSLSERTSGAVTMDNPAMIAIMGPVYKHDGEFTLGALMSNQTILFTALITAIANIILVVRNTRSDEESGRTELLRSKPIGRITNYSSLLITTITMNFLIFLFLSSGLYTLKITSMDMNGSLLYGCVVAVFGLFISCLAMFFSNLFESSRTVYVYSFLSLGVFYLIRAIGDIGHSDLSLLSPLGWVVRSQVYTDNNWFFSIILIISSFILVVLALYISYFRDMGDSLLKIERKKNRSSILLKTPSGLFMKLIKKSFFGWIIFSVCLGISYGYLLNDVESFMKTIAYLSPNGNKELIKQFISVIFPLLTVIIGVIPVILIVNRAVDEERSGRLEIIYSKKIYKRYPLASVTGIAIVQSICNQFVFSISFWLSGQSVLNFELSYKMIFISAMMFVSAILIFISLSVFLIAFFPKFSKGIWLYYVYTLFVMLLGNTLKLPEIFKKLSPFEWLSNYPVDQINAGTFLMLIVIGLVIILLSLLGYSNRDKMR